MDGGWPAAEFNASPEAAESLPDGPPSHRWIQQHGCQCSPLGLILNVGARLVVTRPEGSSAAGVPSGDRGDTAPPLEVARPAGDSGAVTDLLVALLVPDHESPAAH